jgi:hypothetical protein
MCFVMFYGDFLSVYLLRVMWGDKLTKKVTKG